MTKFARLTKANGGALYVNPEHVVAFWETPDDGGPGKCVIWDVTVASGDDEGILVAEHPDTVADILREALK